MTAWVLLSRNLGWVSATPRRKRNDSGRAATLHPRGSHARLLAARVAAHAQLDPEFAAVVRVEIVQAAFDLDECMLRRQVCISGEETVLAAADVTHVRLVELDSGEADHAREQDRGDDAVGMPAS